MPGVLMIAGEASGDLHGAGVVRELRRLRPGLPVYGIGGPRMRAAGMETFFDISQTAILGFTEVVKHLPFVLKMFRKMKSLVRERRPQLIIPIDYPGFNLRFARFAHSRGIPVLYYISPQVWAWGRGRVRKIARTVDHMAVIFRFEEEFYRQRGVPATFVGHPLLESLRVGLSREEFFSRFGLEPARPLLGLLPGSRVQEVRRLLPEMLHTADWVSERLPGVQIAVSRAPQVPEEVYRTVPGSGRVRLVSDTYSLMAHATALIVASGTATVEAAIIGTPFAVVYRVSPLSYWLGKRLVRVDHIAMANIVAGRRLVPEFVQNEFAAGRVGPAVLQWFQDAESREKMRRQLAALKEKLGAPEASRKVARLAVEMMRKENAHGI